MPQHQIGMPRSDPRCRGLAIHRIDHCQGRRPRQERAQAGPVDGLITDQQHTDRFRHDRIPPRLRVASVAMATDTGRDNGIGAPGTQPRLGGKRGRRFER